MLQSRLYRKVSQKKYSPVLDTTVSRHGTSKFTYALESSYTERYARWCERSATQLMGSPLLYLIGCASFERSVSIRVRHTSRRSTNYSSLQLRRNRLVRRRSDSSYFSILIIVRDSILMHSAIEDWVKHCSVRAFLTVSPKEE